MSTHDEHPEQDSETPAILDENALALIEEQADRSIRRVWHEGRWFFSVIDVIGVLTDSPTPKRYWAELKSKLHDEGFDEVFAKSERLRMKAADGKQRLTDAADTETLLRIIQSVPSPKAEPVKQWLARVGAQRLDAVARPIDTTQSRVRANAIPMPEIGAPPEEWLAFHQQMAALYSQQLAYARQLAQARTQLSQHETQLDEHADRLDDHTERLDDHDAQFAVMYSWMGELEAEQRILPELLERLGPQSLTPAHQAKVKELAVRLHELRGTAYQTIYGALNADFHVARYSDIPEARWDEVMAWFQVRLDNAKR